MKAAVMSVGGFLFGFAIATAGIHVNWFRPPPAPLGEYAEYPAAQVYQPDEKPLGRSYGDWGQRWWQWVTSMPRDRNPLARQDLPLDGSLWPGSVMMLIGDAWAGPNPKGPCERTVSAPPDKAILVPIAACAVYFTTGNPTGLDSELHNESLGVMDRVENLSMTVDDRQIPNLSRFRVQSDPFLVRKTNKGRPVFPHLIVERRMVSDGFFVMLKPLPPGEHVIHVQARDREADKPGTGVIDVTYKITVTAK
jgi:hypothetical protein